MGPAQGRIGEVVEASSRRCAVQCYRLYESPPLGALARVGDPPVYALITEVSTEALDPGRPVIARGEDAATVEEVYRSNPQLDKLLCTRLRCLIVGHLRDGAPVAGLPPLPPKIHSFAHPCPADEAEALVSSPDFARLLLNSDLPSPDEVIVACLRLAGRQAADGQGLLHRAGNALARELSDQVPRLNAILRRLT